MQRYKNGLITQKENVKKYSSFAKNAQAMLIFHTIVHATLLSAPQRIVWVKPTLLLIFHTLCEKPSKTFRTLMEAKRTC